MGNIRPSFIKIRAIRLVEEHGEKFTDDFDQTRKWLSNLPMLVRRSCETGFRIRDSLPTTQNRLMGLSDCPFGLIGTERLYLFMVLNKNHWKNSFFIYVTPTTSADVHW